MGIVEVAIDTDHRMSLSERTGLNGALSPLAADALEPLINAARSKGHSYRHTFRLSSGGDMQMNLDFQYKLGECIVFRPGFSQDDVFPVRALPGECS